ncbi:DUF2087 domain-containing protein [Pseudonocardia spinosispora]|uniref:DUF2087 domain-containing protein n=1 Tax=Pseudonocardia spinosispora TaxID=103441 RepID=UPI00040E2199|nr:DUF2087 domain-containing protein [Pseudonocardia spinosispora]
MNAAELVGLLAEPERLRVVAALALGARTPDEILEASGLPAKDVASALRRLHSGGLVEDAPDGYLLRSELFKQVARDATAPPVVEKLGYADPKVEQLVRTFVRDGRLVGLPGQRGRRRTVLEHLVTSFEPGVHYSEREVDTVLRAWSEGGPVDYVTLRRYLVDESLLDRDGGEYWRSGGWIDV